MGPIHIAAIPLQEWFRSLLEYSQFRQTHNIVLLSWERGSCLPSPQGSPVIIRPMNVVDLPAVAKVDWAAFGKIWQNSPESLRLAFNQAAVATVAEDARGLVGYQISTASPMGGHLARLAVIPDAQGNGIGYQLVYDVLTQFEQRGAMRVTVNTQEDNASSLSLYKKARFRRTGEKYPVYELVG
jgi:ribosomal protein S18 acetylase RimI-like enzyme